MRFAFGTTMNRAIFLLCLLALTPLACKRETPAPATAPTTAPATAPATKPAPTTSYVEVIRQSHPKVPATQPLGVPVDLPDAGRYVLSEPVYLDARGDLWITHPNAPPLLETLKSADKEQVHIAPERIAFVQWAVDENGKWFPRVVVRDEANNLTWIDNATAYEGPTTRPAVAGRGYRWDDVIYYGDDRLVIPTDRGVSIVTFTPEFSETYHEINKDAGANPPVVLPDPGGLIAFSPWTGDKPGDKPGGDGAWRYADGKWTPLGAEQHWPAKLVHVVPLLDGSVMQLYRDEPSGPVKLALGPLGTTAVDENAVMALVEQLSDDDPDRRNKAFNELMRYGPPTWPLLDRVREDQPPEARVRLEQILANRITPTLGGRKAVDGVMQLANRFVDGGVLFFLPAGIVTPPPDELQPPTLTKPAWISFRPGRSVELLEPVLVKDAEPKTHRIYAFGDEWVVSDAKAGAQRLLGNHLEPIAGKEESSFGFVVGTDRRGRWLLRKSADGTETLIVDPTLPDMTPKLPVWVLNVPQGLVGWDEQDYGAMKSGDAWALHEHGWKPIDKTNGKFITGLNDEELKQAMRMIEQRQKQQPQPARPPFRQNPPKFAKRLDPANQPATQPSTQVASSQPTTAPATSQGTVASSQPAEAPILIDADGRKYFDGRQILRVIEKDGRDISWKLPANATGSDPAVLLRTIDGILFLFNQSGRVIRIKPTPDAPEPFAVEAVFTEKIPKPDKIQRIWLDPAGRIVMAYDTHTLAILFPEGRIPRDIAVLVTETKSP